MTYEEIAVEKDNAREDRPVYDDMDVDYHPQTVSSNYDGEAEDQVNTVFCTLLYIWMINNMYLQCLPCM